MAEVTYGDRTFTIEKPKGKRGFRMTRIVTRVMEDHPELIETYNVKREELLAKRTFKFTKAEFMSKQGKAVAAANGITAETFGNQKFVYITEGEPSLPEVLVYMGGTIMEAVEEEFFKLLTLSTISNEEFNTASRKGPEALEKLLGDRQSWWEEEAEDSWVKGALMQSMDIIVGLMAIELPDGPGNVLAPETGPTPEETTSQSS